MENEIRETPTGARRQGGATRFPGQGAFPDENVWAGYRSLPPGDPTPYERMRVVNGNLDLALIDTGLFAFKERRRLYAQAAADREAIYREAFTDFYGELPEVQFTGEWQARPSFAARLFLAGCLLLAAWAVVWTIARVLT